MFFDDVPKIRAAVEGATAGGNVYVEFRVRYDDESVHWIAAAGQIASGSSERLLRGAIYEISARKALEVRLLALNETLEARVAELGKRLDTSKSSTPRASLLLPNVISPR